MNRIEMIDLNELREAIMDRVLEKMNPFYRADAVELKRLAAIYAEYKDAYYTVGKLTDKEIELIASDSYRQNIRDTADVITTQMKRG